MTILATINRPRVFPTSVGKKRRITSCRESKRQVQKARQSAFSPRENQIRVRIARMFPSASPSRKGERRSTRAKIGGGGDEWTGARETEKVRRREKERMRARDKESRGGAGRGRGEERAREREGGRGGGERAKWLSTAATRQRSPSSTMMDAFMNDPTEPRTSLLLPPSSFSYFIFTFLDRRKSANLWVIRPLCRVDPHRVCRGLGAYRTIRRAGGGGGLYRGEERVDFSPFRIPSRHRTVDSARGSPRTRAVVSCFAAKRGE